MTKGSRKRAGRRVTKGTPEIRRTVAGVRIRVASGTHAERTVWRINELLTALGQHGHLGYLKAVAAGDITPLELVEMLRGVDIATLSRKPQTPIKRAVEAFIARMPEGYHKRNVAYDLRLLTAQLPDTATDDDLVRALKEDRARAERDGTASGWNHRRNHVRVFLRSLHDEPTPAYERVAYMRPLKVTRRREGHPCEVREALAIGTALGPLMGRVWLTMCLTGMGPDELWGSWGLEGRHIRVRGTKRRGRDRLVPGVALLVVPGFAPFTPPYTMSWFAQRLKRVTEKGIQPYDGRRTFARWAELAGVVPVNLEVYMGHGPRNLERLYGRGNVEPHLDADAERVAGWMAAQGPVGYLATDTGNDAGINVLS